MINGKYGTIAFQGMAGVPNRILPVEWPILNLRQYPVSLLMQLFGPFMKKGKDNDVEGHIDERSLQLAFEDLHFFAKYVVMLGSYPAHFFRCSTSNQGKS